MVEEASYEVIRKVGQLELRHYPKLLVASVGDQDETDAFSILFRFINGGNDAGGKIPMTVPVLTNQDRGPIKIAMTAPVLIQGRRMSFIMPQKYTLETLPRPDEQGIVIEELPEMDVAVLRFRGRARDSDVAERTEELLELVRKEGLMATGRPWSMFYNSPFVPGVMRHNEVAVEVVR